MSIFNPNPQTEAKGSIKRTWTFRLLVMMTILMGMLLGSPQPSEAQEPQNGSDQQFSIQQLEDGSHIVEGGIFIKAEAGFQVEPNFARYQWQEVKRINLSSNRSNPPQQAILYHISPTPNNLAEYEQLVNQFKQDSEYSKVDCVGVNGVTGSPNTVATGLSGSPPVSLSASSSADFTGQWAFNQFQPFNSQYNGLNVEIAVFDGFRNNAATYWADVNEVDFGAINVSPSHIEVDPNYPKMPEHGEMIISQINYLAPAATILPVRVLNENLLGDTMTLIEGLDKVIERKKDNDTSNLNRKMIVNMSLGLKATPNSDRCDIKIMNELLNTAEAEGIIVVAAAGNEADDENEKREVEAELEGNSPPAAQYPANVDTVIAVGASNSAGQPTNYSNKGEVMIAGGEISTCMNMVDKTTCLEEHGIIGRMPTSSGDEYIAWEGTSFAAPLVSGIIAKSLYCNMGLVPDEMRDLIDLNPNKTNNTIDIEYLMNFNKCAPY